MERFDPSPGDAPSGDAPEWERLLETAFGPVEPPGRLRRAVVPAPRSRRVLPLALAYAAGALTVLGSVALLRPPPASPEPPALSFEPIADRLPPPAPVRDPEPALPTRSVSAPRIS
jgi:hypothetical protein